MLRRLLKILGWFTLIIVLYLGGILLYGTLTDWTPTGTELLTETSAPNNGTAPITDSVVTFTTWNVGYGGLGAKDRFFYNDGGFFWTDLGGVRASEEAVREYTDGQGLTLRSTLSDFFLLQEVDTAARRSRYVNQLAGARAAQPEYSVYYAPNFQSNRVPIPLFQPWDHYGYVRGGLVSLSRFHPDTAQRIQLPGEFPWPTRLFQLDRCLLRQVFPTAFDGRNLIVYNLHLSAYDEDGQLRRQQTAALRELAVADYEAGHFVVAGGDWNQLPPGFNWFSLNPTVERTQLPPALGFDLMPPGWKYAYDPATATVRNSDVPFDEAKNRFSVIDFFLISPNLRIRAVKGLGQRFAYSDHQPVYCEVEFLR